MARWWPRAKSALVAKSGAEGYFCVGHADGLGLALKIIDADPAARARNVATVVAIRRAGWISDADLNGALRAFGPRVPIFNLAGRYTGEVRPTDSWGIPTTQDNSLTAVAVSCADPTRRRGHRVKAPADRAVACGRPLKVAYFCLSLRRWPMARHRAGPTSFRIPLADRPASSRAAKVWRGSADLSSPGFARELLAGRRCRRVLPGSVAAPDPLHVRSHGSDRAHSRPALQPSCS